jgi:hypothetical protein
MVGVGVILMQAESSGTVGLPPRVSVNPELVGQ